MTDYPAICCGVCAIFCFETYRTCCCISEAPPKPAYNVLCLGISNAGKTTLLSTLTGENTDAIVPTVGFIIKDIVLPSAILKVKELGGAESVRKYWDRYYQNVHGVVFVVDGSCTNDELQETISALHKALNDTELVSKPWLILCNKQDLDGACTEERAAEELKLYEMLQGRDNVVIRSCSKFNSDGLHSTMDQLGDMLNQYYNNITDQDEQQPMNAI